MRRAKFNSKTIIILATLSDNSEIDYDSDESDADCTWQSHSTKKVGTSDFFGI